MFSNLKHVMSIVVRVFFLMIRRPPRSTLDRSSAASDVYKRQADIKIKFFEFFIADTLEDEVVVIWRNRKDLAEEYLSLIHISEPTRPY